MNFRPELADKVMAGEKTVTRRLVSDNPRSPWWREDCSLDRGRDYAVCPGRGKNAIGRAVVRTVHRERLGHLTDHEARAEGFPDAKAFEDAFAAINGKYEPDAEVWVIGIEVVASAEERS